MDYPSSKHITMGPNAQPGDQGRRKQVDSGEQLLASLMEDLRANRLKLPTLPEVAVKVRRVVEDGNASASQVARMVSIDTALSARLLQVANSPLYRGVVKIDSIQAAIARLGSDQVRNLVTGLLVQQLYQTRHPGLRQRMQDLWQHSARVAAISHTLARRLTRLNPEFALLAGLIHDIGALPIISRAESIPELTANPVMLDMLIEKLHTVFGRLVVETWKFAPELVAVVTKHEDLQYQSANGPDYVDVVMVANVHSRAGTTHRHAMTDLREVPAFLKLGPNAELILKTLEDSRQEIREIEQLFATAA